MKKILKGYMVLFVVSIFLLLIVACTFDRKVYYTENSTSVQYLNTSEVTQEEGNILHIRQTIPVMEQGDMILAFYTVHQEVIVEMDGEAFYEVYAGDNMFGDTPGSGWNYVAIPREKMGHEVEITLRATYDALKDKVPEFFVGTRMSVVKEIIFNRIISICICVLTILVGFILILYGAFLRKKVREITDLNYLGIFAVIMGVWSLNEAMPLPLVSDLIMISTYLAYLSLRLMTIPVLMFIRGMMVSKDHILWKVCGVVSIVEAVISIGLQIFGIVNFRETLVGIHGVCIFCMICVSYIIIQEARKKILTRKMKINLMFMGLVFAGFFADILIYYRSVGDSNMIGRVCFLLYIVVLGILSVQDVMTLVDKGKEAEIYHRLAFSDALTGCYNRTAYVRHIALYEMPELEQVQVFMMDLNNLKCCNDNYGHTLGDNYIIHASNFIMNSFEENAKIYRIGGDEFCVLTRGLKLSEVQKLLANIEKFSVELTADNEVFMGCIACGFAQYEPGDADVYAVTRRADAKMYENKNMMKCKVENKK